MVTQKILDETDKRYRERLASLGYGCPPPQALVQKPRASSPAAKQTRSSHGLRILSERFFDPDKPKRLIEGVMLSSPAPNSHGVGYIAKGVEFSLPMPLLLGHDKDKLIGRILAIHTHLDGSITFHAEVANAGLGFADLLWGDVKDRKLDCASFQALSLTAIENPKRLITSWALEEISIVLNGADPGAVLTRVYERLPGEHLGRAATREIWAGPLTIWDESNMLPRATDPPPVKESALAVAASLSTARRAQLAALRAA